MIFRLIKRENTKHTNTQTQHMTKCQKDPTCGICLRFVQGYKKIHIPMCQMHKYKKSKYKIHKYSIYKILLTPQTSQSNRAERFPFWDFFTQKLCIKVKTNIVCAAGVLLRLWIRIKGMVWINLPGLCSSFVLVRIMMRIRIKAML